jgi:hypothetical protein
MADAVADPFLSVPFRGSDFDPAAFDFRSSAMIGDSKPFFRGWSLTVEAAPKLVS